MKPNGKNNEEEILNGGLKYDVTDCSKATCAVDMNRGVPKPKETYT